MDRLDLPASRRARAAWCFFDWANSAFPTVIITFVFSVYFVGAIAEDKISGTAQWGYAISFSGIAIALLSPVLGSVADRAGRRKPWLAACSALTIVCSVLLWFAYPDPGYALFALLVLAIANVGFEVGQVFYNAMLPGLVARDAIGRLSGWGWGLGYAGGLCSLVVLLVFFIQADPPPFGLSPEAHEHIRVIGPFVALWFALFCIPLFALVPDAPSRQSGARQAVREGLATLVSTIRSVRRYRDIAWFLCARLFYVDGMNTMFAFGAVYASQTFDMSTEEVIQFAIVMNVAAGLGAAGFGWIDDLLGSKRTITLALLGLIGFGVPLLIVETKLWFWIIAVPMGLFMGPAQAASRSFMAHLAPPEYRNEMFGLFAFSGRATAYVGPFVLATVTLIAESQRAGMATIVVFLAVGLAILVLKVRR